MNIRLANVEEIPQIKGLFKIAKAYMKANGNPNQWIGNYPEEAVLQRDIQNGNCYVIEEEGELLATFTFIVGEDPTYAVIEGGAWRSTDTYGTIHRLASSGKKKDIAKACFDYCKTKMPYLRVDTHADNQIMNAVIQKNGFVRCGTIYVANGTPRNAYDYRD